MVDHINKLCGSRRGNNKSLILLTYSFPPDNRISALRPYKMAEAFAGRGWDVYVLRCDNNGAEKNGKKDLSGIDVTGFRSSWLSEVLAGGVTGKGLFLGENGLIIKILRRFFLPEHSFLMRKRMGKALLDLTCKVDPSCIISISYPFVSHLVAKDCVDSNGVPVWVADNRDMWSGNPYRGIKLCPSIYERSLEKRAFSRANVVTFASEETRKIYRSRHGLDNTMTVYNGFEGDVADNSIEDIEVKIIKFVHTGSLYDGKRLIEPLFHAVNLVSEYLGVKCVMEFYGKGCDHLTSKKFSSLCNGLVDLKIMGQVSREEAYIAQRSAHFLVVAMGGANFDKTYVPAKIFEYARELKPVIAICDPLSELAMIVDKHDLGVAGFCHKAISSYIIKFIEANGDSFDINPDKVSHLSAEFQFGGLVSEVEKQLRLA